MKNKTKIYLDYAATTPLDKKVFKIIRPYFYNKFGNPSSIHQWGQEAQIAIDKSRNQVAKFLNSRNSEIVFTGSASESNNLAIRGLLKNLKARKSKKNPSTDLEQEIHIIASKTEHKSVLNTCKDIENQDIKVTYLSVNKDGIINIKELKDNITPETRLISIAYVNNETGAIQPIIEIGKILEQINKNRKNKIFFHTDAVQAANWIDCDIKKLKVDLLTLSGHKIYGPKGVGILYIKQDTPVSSVITGGDQEGKIRAGTENVANIVGMGFALEQIKKQNKTQTQKLRDKLIKEILSKISNSSLNCPQKKEKRAPHIANFSFNGVEGESLVLGLDQEGIGVSTGSACTSQALKPSHVLKAMGLSDLQAHSSLRISLGKHTTDKEINYFLRILPKVVKRLRKISGR